GRATRSCAFLLASFRSSSCLASLSRTSGGTFSVFIVADAFKTATQQNFWIHIIYKTRKMRFLHLATFANHYFRSCFVIINSLKRITSESARQQRPDFRASICVFKVKLDGVNLIEDSLLESCVLEHLSIDSRYLFLVHNSLDSGIARDKWCVRNFECLWC